MSDVHALTGLQLSILDELWDRGEATTQQIHGALEGARGLALTTVATLLSRLERRGVVQHRKEGRQYVYRALVTRSDVRRSKVKELTEALFQGDATALVSHLVSAADTDAADLERIKAMIAEAEAGSDGDG